MKKLLLITLLFIVNVFAINAQSIMVQEIPLYEGKLPPNAFDVPNEEKMYKSGSVNVIEKISQATLTAYIPEKQKSTGTAVVICPGGGYAVVAIDHEGHDVAKRFAENGIAAFVLKYRLPNSKTSSNPSMIPLQDAQEALLMVRQNADKWNISTDKVGIMGFSAGGHLASTVGTHFDKNDIEIQSKGNVRPDFMILIYPVISFDSKITHSGSCKNLLGENPSKTEIDLFSNEKQVTEETPPTFLIHAADDTVVPVKNSICFAEALIEKGIPVELHVFPKGGHGFGLNNKTTQTAWFDLCTNWLHFTAIK